MKFSSVMMQGALFAKISGMRKKLLTTEDYMTMASQKNVAGGLSFLKGQDAYKEILRGVSEETSHREYIEKLLKKMQIYDFLKLRKFVNLEQRKFLKVLMVKYDIYYIKQCIERLSVGGNTAEVLNNLWEDYERLSGLNVSKLLAAKDTAAFIDALKDTRYYKVLYALYQRGKEPTLFEIEDSLDIFYFLQMQKSINAMMSKEEQKDMSEYVTRDGDLLNILWIYRCKAHYRLNNDLIYGMLVPVKGGLPPAFIKKLVESGSVEEFLEYINETRYKGVFEHSDILYEKVLMGFLVKILKRKMKENPYSLVSALVYLTLKELEIDNVFSIIEGLRYSLSAEEIMKYVYSQK